MKTKKALNGKPYAGNPHVRFDEGEVASAATSRRGSLLYNKNKLMTIAAVAVSAALPMAANAAFTSTTNIVVNGVSWTVTLDTDNNTAMIGDGTGSTSSGGHAAISSTAYPVSGGQVVTIPSTITVEGTDYRVTTLGTKSFASIPIGLGVIIPTSVTAIWNYAFNATQTANYCVKGPDSVTDVASQTYQTISASAKYVSFKNSARRFIFVGPNVKLSGSYNPFLDTNGSASELTVLVPSRSDNTTWDSANTGTGNKDFGGGDKTTICRYGPAQEFDLLMGDTYVTAIPTTANALTNVLNWAQTFKTAFNLDTRISITNAFVIEEGLITAEKMQYATFNSLMFKVETQAQLDSVLAVVPAHVPVALDASDSKVELTVPQGREVWVRLSADGRQGKYTPKIRGLIISFF